MHSVYGFTFAYLKIDAKRYHQIAGLWHIIMLAVLWSTQLIVADDFVYRQFLGLKKPYIEPEMGPLGPYFLFYSAAAGVFDVNAPKFPPGVTSARKMLWFPMARFLVSSAGKEFILAIAGSTSASGMV